MVILDAPPGLSTVRALGWFLHPAVANGVIDFVASLLVLG